MELDLRGTDLYTQGMCVFNSSQTQLCVSARPVSLGWDYVHVLQAIPILSPLLFMPSLYSTFQFEHSLIIHRDLLSIQDYAREGLRTLVVAKKDLTRDEYADWATRHHAAR